MLEKIKHAQQTQKNVDACGKCALGEALLLLLSFALFLGLVSVSLAPLRVRLGTLPLGAPPLRMCNGNLLWVQCRPGSLRV